MNPVRDLLDRGMKSFPSPGTTGEVVAFLCDILRARRDEIDSEWHLSTNDDSSWRSLRSRRVQLCEDLEILESVHGVLIGNPIVAKRPSNRQKPDQGYGEL